MKKGNSILERGQTVISIVCLTFLLGIVFGAILANVSGATASDGQTLSSQVLGNTENASFSSVYFKSFKYIFLIWLGGWLKYGLFVSGSIFLFKSISIGYSVAYCMLLYGKETLGHVVLKFLPSNCIIIPVYVCIMGITIFYLDSWNEHKGKRSYKREKRKKQTEYVILLLLCMSVLALGVGVEMLTFSS